ncbi:MAG TPA: single-stranded-DNA-specific exonuclease RecJ [Thermoanaerobaculia bacterium]|nr:single-stranded-DNA-specific exonuclease RecJ [Thermoanaerobaculia bacterium]
MSAAVWSPAPVPPSAGRLVAGGISPILAPLLARRGVGDVAEARRYLSPSVDELHDPFLLRGMEEAVARLEEARRRRERVAVVGDYDVDGVSGTALVLAALQACGVEGLPIMPHRMRDGYGLQPIHVEQAYAAGCRVIVTVDCGISSIEAISVSVGLGIDVIVTDHHLPPPGLVLPAIVINPRQASCGYPFAELAGAGLALKLAMAMLVRAGRSVPPAPLLRVACLGTIADLVPLRGENRVIASLGLRALAEARSEGLRALLRVAGVKPPFRAADVGFRLGPRLNAAGRLDHAQKALDLLLSRDPQRAAALADELDGWNRLRRDEERQVVDQAMATFAGTPPGDLPGMLVAWSADWHRGVVGIAAGRLARDLHRPTLLLAQEGDTTTGSGRSIPGVHLHEFLQRWRERLLRFGGHAAAVGLTVRSADLEPLHAEWLRHAIWDPELLVRRYEYELDLRAARAFDVALLTEVRQLEPFGIENPAPLARVSGLRLYGAPRTFGADHVSAIAVGDDGGRVRLVGWRFAPRIHELQGRFDALGHLDWDDFVEAPALRLVDLRPAEPS